jgi:hypothetical protein
MAPTLAPATFDFTFADEVRSSAAPSNLAPVESMLRGEDSAHARRVVVRDAQGRDVGQALVTLAEESTLAERFGLDRKVLSRAIVLSDVSVDAAHSDEVLPGLIYLACRRGRILDRAVVVSGASTAVSELPACLEDLRPLTKLAPLELGGKAFAPLAERLDIILHRAYSSASLKMAASLHELFVPEAVETLDLWIGRFFQSAWFTSIFDGTMSREQYIYTLSNMHQFVRWTTRLIGLAVGQSNDRLLRGKWIEHLREEVDHERIVERDLTFLGADVDYVTSMMTPTAENQAFMVAQESMIGFHKDPVLFMGAPFVAEGFASRLDARFLEALRKTAAGWGIENPKTVTAFVSSHMEYDGGGDGHFELSRKILGDYLKTDLELRRFLNVIRMAANAFDRAYTSYVEDLAIFGATPKKG